MCVCMWLCVRVRVRVRVRACVCVRACVRGGGCPPRTPQAAGSVRTELRKQNQL